MGADLIGFLVTAPLLLSKHVGPARARYDEIVHEVALVADRLRDAGEEFYPDGEPWPDTLPDPVEPQDLEYSWIRLLQAVAPHGDGTLIDAVEQVIGMGVGRDVSWRADPHAKDRAIVFAGERSWGDEPEGLGYTTIRDLLVLGLDKELDIA